MSRCCRGERHPFYDIERAIGAGELVPYYEPIVDIKTGAIVGAEVLVRWRKCDGSLVLPNTFVPLLEPTDLILDMTRSIMRQVSEEVGPLLEHRTHMYVAFNIAPRHFASDLLIDDIASIFVGGPLSTSQIVLELTERYEIEACDPQSHRRVALGSIAIDDVAPFNGLSYILSSGRRYHQDRQDRGRDRNRSPFPGDRRYARRPGPEPAIRRSSRRVWRISSRSSICASTESARRRVSCFSPPVPGSAFIQLIEAIDPLVPVDPRT